MSCHELRKQIARALKLDERHGAELRDDEQVAGMILKFRELIQMTDSLMYESGVGEACGKCAEKTGSCCFREMGESYGFLQLYVNLLLECSLPESPYVPKNPVLPKEVEFQEGCHFMGEKGCKLQARHSFCLNYFCPNLKKLLGGGPIGKLERLIGRQLQAGWELELYLNRRIAELI